MQCTDTVSSSFCTDIAAEKGKEFVVRTNIKKSRTKRRGVKLLVDGVEVASYFVPAHRFGQNNSTEGWDVDGVKYSFSFGAIETSDGES